MGLDPCGVPPLPLRPPPAHAQQSRQERATLSWSTGFLAWPGGCPRGWQACFWQRGQSTPLHLPTSHPSPLPLPRPTSTHDRPSRESWVVWCGVGRMRVPPGPGCLGGLLVRLLSVFVHPCFAGELHPPGPGVGGAPPGGGGVHPAGVRHHGRDGLKRIQQATRAVQAGGHPRPTTQTQCAHSPLGPSRRRGRDLGGPEVGWPGRVGLIGLGWIRGDQPHADPGVQEAASHAHPGCSYGA